MLYGANPYLYLSSWARDNHVKNPYKIMNDNTLDVMQALNAFCFSDMHDDECNGCVYKDFEKCPVQNYENYVYQGERG